MAFIPLFYASQKNGCSNDESHIENEPYFCVSAELKRTRPEP